MGIEEPSEETSRRLVVEGRVQGVGFRVNCARKARALGLSGWVRNLSDGRVEILLQGSPESVAQVERWCAFGPQLAEVTSVEVSDEPHAREHGFAIR
jgi:acylphosphatase